MHDESKQYTPEELAAMMFKATHAPPPAEDAPVPAESETSEASAKTEPEEPKLFTWDDLRDDTRSRDVIIQAEFKIDRLEQDVHDVRRERGRARTEASDAVQKLEQYQRAMREAAAEFNAAGVRTTVDHLVHHAPELPALVRRLARTVREIGPDRDALRREVARLNGEALEHPKAIALKDAEISELRKKIDAGEQREKALERTTQTMQIQRDAAQRQLKEDQQSFGLEASRANDELRGTSDTLHGHLAELAKAWANSEAK